ncbi:hypothetical protein HK105_200920 [Polyrhizophydium stewartii]|uniref:Fork-head domain-containing protein n=1 Tax=Polyrhizophydium stewartii TaxID=2732419 RepID=A0ABR4NIC9_9FUNG
MVHHSPLPPPLHAPPAAYAARFASASSLASASASAPPSSISGPLSPDNPPAAAGADTATRPTIPYATLITEAIESTPLKRITLNEIYEYAMARYPYYRHAGSGRKLQPANSIRHNLSLNKSFERVPRPPNERGKGAYWTLNPSAVVRRGRNRVRSSSDPSARRASNQTGAAGPCALAFSAQTESAHATFSPSPLGAESASGQLPLSSHSQSDMPSQQSLTVQIRPIQMQHTPSIYSSFSSSAIPTDLFPLASPDLAGDSGVFGGHGALQHLQPRLADSLASSVSVSSFDGLSSAHSYVSAPYDPSQSRRASLVRRFPYQGLRDPPPPEIDTLSSTLNHNMSLTSADFLVDASVDTADFDAASVSIGLSSQPPLQPLSASASSAAVVSAAAAANIMSTAFTVGQGFAAGDSSLGITGVSSMSAYDALSIVGSSSPQIAHDADGGDTMSVSNAITGIALHPQQHHLQQNQQKQQHVPAAASLSQHSLHSLHSVQSAQSSQQSSQQSMPLTSSQSQVAFGPGFFATYADATLASPQFHATHWIQTSPHYSRDQLQHQQPLLHPHQPHEYQHHAQQQDPYQQGRDAASMCRKLAISSHPELPSALHLAAPSGYFAYAAAAASDFDPMPIVNEAPAADVATIYSFNNDSQSHVGGSELGDQTIRRARTKQPQQQQQPQPPQTPSQQPVRQSSQQSYTPPQQHDAPPPPQQQQQQQLTPQGNLQRQGMGVMSSFDSQLFSSAGIAGGIVDLSASLTASAAASGSTPMLPQTQFATSALGLHVSTPQRTYLPQQPQQQPQPQPQPQMQQMQAHATPKSLPALGYEVSQYEYAAQQQQAQMQQLQQQQTQQWHDDPMCDIKQQPDVQPIIQQHSLSVKTQQDTPAPLSAASSLTHHAIAYAPHSADFSMPKSSAFTWDPMM